MITVFKRLRLWAAWNPYDPERLQGKGLGIEPVKLEESAIRQTVLRVVVLSFGAFVVWACTAPLDGGVVISGSVAVAGSRKAVQHNTGGVVQKILVQEGSRVKQGDLVIKVNPLSSEANLTNAEGLYINLLASEARLLSERSGGDIRWKPELTQFGPQDKRVAEAKLLQLQLFSSRRAELESQLRILREQANSQQAEAESQVKVMVEKRSQLALIAVEARNTVQLAKEGFVPETNANAVLRAQSSLESDIASLQAAVARTRGSIASTELQIAQQRQAFIKDIDNQLSEIQKNREATQDRVQALKFERNLTEVRSPATGTVIGLKVTTVGGVVTAGQVLMEILPEGGKLIVEAEVPLASIDKVRQGQAADLRFSAFNQDTTPVVEGLVTLVGVDKLVAVAGGAEHYLALVETTAAGLQRLGENRIQPGMPVEVIVKTGERTFMTYLLKPLTDKFARSFKD